MKNKMLAIVLSCLTLFTSANALAQNSEFIARAIVTSAIENREPVDQLDVVASDISKVYLFTEVRKKANSMITHRWFHQGRLEAEVVLKIGSNRWRTYSSKNIVQPSHKGEWQVEIVDQDNKLIGSTNFIVN